MPRYLAINYHKELFQESRNLLQKILIPLPCVEENKISAPDFSCTVSDLTRLSMSQNDIGNNICELENHMVTNHIHFKEFEKIPRDPTDMTTGECCLLYKSRTEESLCFETLESINENNLDTHYTQSLGEMISKLDIVKVPELLAEAVRNVTSNTKLETLRSKTEPFPDVEIEFEELHKDRKEREIDIESDCIIFSGESFLKDMKQMLRDVLEENLENQEFTMHDNPQMCMLPKLVPIEKLEKIGWMKEEQQEAEIFLDPSTGHGNSKCVQELDLHSHSPEELSPLKTVTKEMKLCELPVPPLSNADMKGLLDTTGKSLHPSELELELSTGLRLNRISISEPRMNEDSQPYKPQTIQETMKVLCIQRDEISRNHWLSLPWNLTESNEELISNLNKPEILFLSGSCAKSADSSVTICTVDQEDFRRCPELERSPEQSLDSSEEQEASKKYKKIFPSKKKMFDADEQSNPYGPSSFGNCESSRYGSSSLNSSSPPKKTLRTNSYSSNIKGIKQHDADSLNAFLELRGQKTQYRVLPTPKLQIQAIKHTACEEQSKTVEDKKKYLTVADKVIPKDKCKLVKVYLSADITKLICSAKLKADGIIKELKKRKYLPEKCDFYSISQDVSKSYTSHMQKYARENQIKSDSHLPFVYHFILECLVCCVHLLVNISAPTALAYLINLYQVNKSQMENSNLIVESLKEFNGQVVQTTEYAVQLIPQLIKELQSSCSQMSPHPKMTKTKEIILHWMQKKMEKHMESDPKVLILCPANCDYLLGEIASFLCQDQSTPTSISFLLNPVVLKPPPCNECVQTRDITDLLSNGNIALVKETTVADDFPWSLFSLVIEYAAAESSSLQKKASLLNIRYFGLQAERPYVISAICDENEPIETYEPMTLIGSTLITHSGNLLHLLEARYNIIIIERNYQLLLMKNQELTSSNFVNNHPDIIFDESTCVLLQKYIPSLNAKKTERNLQAQKLAARLVGLNLKFTKCFLLVCNLTTGGNTNWNNGFSVYMAEVYSSVKSFLQEYKDFDVKVFCVFDVNETAFLIRSLADHCRETSKMWTKERWIQRWVAKWYYPNKELYIKDKKRSWLSAGVSTHEKFLLQFPCINAFVAQLLLTVAPLKSIVGQDAAELKEKYPWIPPRVIHDFCSILRLTSFYSPYHDETEISDVDVTPNFSFSMKSTGDNSDQEDGNFGNQLWTTGPNQYSSYNTTTTTTAKKQYKPSKKRAKMLTFERVKGRKDGQTRLTFY